MPTKIGEFLATGRPVVVNTGLSDVASLVGRHDAGVVVGSSTDRLGAAATELLRLLDDVGTSDRTAALAAEFFDLDAGVDRLVAAYHRMVDDG
jgi:hypothetical protein